MLIDSTNKSRETKVWQMSKLVYDIKTDSLNVTHNI